MYLHTEFPRKLNDPDSKFPFCTVCFFSVCTDMYIYITWLTEYNECQAFCLFAWIGPPHPQATVAPPLWVQEGRHTGLRGRGWGDPIPTKGQTLWYYMYTIIPLRLANIAWRGGGKETIPGIAQCSTKKITKKYSNNYYLVSLEIYVIPYMKKVTEFLDIPRNFTEV